MLDWACDYSLLFLVFSNVFFESIVITFFFNCVFNLFLYLLLFAYQKKKVVALFSLYILIGLIGSILNSFIRFLSHDNSHIP